MNDKSAVRRLITWVDEWITTLTVAPPFSRARRELLEVMADKNHDNWNQIERP